MRTHVFEQRKHGDLLKKDGRIGICIGISYDLALSGLAGKDTRTLALGEAHLRNLRILRRITLRRMGPLKECPQLE